MIKGLLSKFLGKKSKINKSPNSNDKKYVSAHKDLVQANRYLKAGYDSAGTSNELDNRWTTVSSGTFDSIATPGVRKNLRDRARDEICNNCNAIGIIRTLVNDTVGTQVNLQVQTGDPVLDTIIEREFKNWSEAVSLVENLQVARKSRIESGEVFFIKKNNPKLDSLFQLDFQLLEPEYVTSYGNIKRNDVFQNIDGVLVGKHGDILGYMINTSGKEVFHSASKVIQYIRKDRPTQYRGVPEITQALSLFVMHRRFANAVLAAAETAANFAVLLQTDGSAGEYDIGDDYETVEVQSRSIMTMPEGYKGLQLKAEQPTTTYSEYNREIIHQLAQCFQMPFIFAYGDSSDANYSSHRGDFQRYFKALLVEREIIEHQILNNLLSDWWQEAKVIIPGAGQYETTKELNYSWYWDGFEHIDPKKEADANVILKNAGLLTDKDYFSGKGQDWQKKYIQLSKEKKERERLNLLVQDTIDENIQEEIEDDE